MNLPMNMGQVDKYVRVTVAFILIGLTVFDVVTGVLAAIFLVLAFILIIVSLMGFCPAYFPFKFSTKK